MSKVTRAAGVNRSPENRGPVTPAGSRRKTSGVKETGMERRGPAELVLAAAVARRHYLAGQSKVEIADELGLSRFKVARLIDFAREAGIVRIEIVADGELDLDRSARLQERFALRHAVVVDGSRTEAAA